MLLRVQIGVSNLLVAKSSLVEALLVFFSFSLACMLNASSSKKAIMYSFVTPERNMFICVFVVTALTGSFHFSVPLIKVKRVYGIYMVSRASTSEVLKSEPWFCFN